MHLNKHSYNSLYNNFPSWNTATGARTTKTDNNNFIFALQGTATVDILHYDQSSQ